MKIKRCFILTCRLGLISAIGLLFLNFAEAGCSTTYMNKFFINEVNTKENWVEIYAKNPTSITGWSLNSCSVEEIKDKKTSTWVNVCQNVSFDYNPASDGSFKILTFTLALHEKAIDYLLLDNNGDVVDYFRVGMELDDHPLQISQADACALATSCNIHTQGNNGQRNFARDPDGSCAWTEDSWTNNTKDTSNSGGAFDYLRIEHDGEGLTCQPESVTIRACSGVAPACTEYSSGSVTVTLSPTGWIGGDSITFIGSTVKQLARTTSGTVTLGATVTPNPANGIACYNGSTSTCAMNFVNTGFVFATAVNGAEAEVSTQTAGVAFGPYWLRAIRTDDKTKACVSAISTPQTVNFNYSCTDPVTCSSGAQMSVGGSGVSSSATPLSLNFDGDGNASLGNINYLDVGKISLTAIATIGGATLTGTLGGIGGSPFVVKPSHFGVAATCTDGTTNTASQTSPSPGDNKFCRAGKSFSVVATALNASNNPTPNYGKETTPEYVEMTWSKHLPSGGTSGTLPSGNPAYSGAGGVFGTATNYVWSWDEVGILKVVAGVGDDDYLGAGNVSSTAYVGRFYPDHFDVVVTPQCGGFVYGGRKTPTLATGQPFTVKATAMNGKTTPAPTANYTAANGFAKAVNLSLSAGGSAVKLYVDSTEGGSGAIPAAKFAAPSSNGSGQINYNDASGKISFVIDTFPKEPTSISVHAEDEDTVPVPPATSAGTDGSMSVRAGRLVLFNVHGSELLQLSMPLQTQYWTGSAWATNALDSCTDLGSLIVTSTSPCSTPAVGAVVGGKGSLTFNAPVPSVKCSVDVCANLTDDTDNAVSSCRAAGTTTLPWLQGNWDGDGLYNDNPAAVATFGVYQGRAPVIYRRERY